MAAVRSFTELFRPVSVELCVVVSHMETVGEGERERRVMNNKLIQENTKKEEEGACICDGKQKG